MRHFKYVLACDPGAKPAFASYIDGQLSNTFKLIARENGNLTVDFGRELLDLTKGWADDKEESILVIEDQYIPESHTEGKFKARGPKRIYEEQQYKGGTFFPSAKKVVEVRSWVEFAFRMAGISTYTVQPFEWILGIKDYKSQRLRREEIKQRSKVFATDIARRAGRIKPKAEIKDSDIADAITIGDWFVKNYPVDNLKHKIQEGS